MGSEVKILVATNHLVKVGGTERYTYDLIEELKKQNHNVEYFCFEKGDFALRMENRLQCKFMSQKRYDLILANHKPVADYLFPFGLLIQTCHGVFPELEQPSEYADIYVSISEEVQEHLAKNYKIKSIVIYNGINCKKFKPYKPPSYPIKTVLSLCQSEQAHRKIQHFCYASSLKFKKADKDIDNIFEIEKIINDSDLVVGIGRSAYEAMACGRNVIAYDYRYYSSEFSDGLITAHNMQNVIRNNTSGRTLKETLSLEKFRYYIVNSNQANSYQIHQFIKQHFNIITSVKKYFNLYSLSKDRYKKPIFKSLTFFKKQHKTQLLYISKTFYGKQKKISRIITKSSYFSWVDHCIFVAILGFLKIINLFKNDNLMAR